MRVAQLVSWALWATAVSLGVATSCSLQNREGPDVSCADLECGRVNGCAEGIIAQCSDGHTVRFHVCSAYDGDVCEEPWQIPGRYRCTEWTTECEGCDPSAPGCGSAGADAGGGGAVAAGGAGGAGGAPSAGGAGGAGGSVPSGGAGGAIGSGGSGGATGSAGAGGN